MARLLRILILFTVIIGLNCSPQQRREQLYKSGFSRQVQEREPQELLFVVSATNLESVDPNSSKLKPNVYVEVHSGIVPPRGSGIQGKYLGVSETLRNESDPKWSKIFKTEYTKETYQKLYLQVREQSLTGSIEPIGDALIDLDEYTEYGHQLTVPLKGTKDSSITIQNTAPFSFTLSLKNIPALDGALGTLSDPYVECYFRYGRYGRDYKFHTTSTLDNTHSASWDNPIRFENFIRGTGQMFHFVVKDADSTSADDDVGDAFLEVDAFVDKKQTSVLKLPSSEATLYVKWNSDN